MFSNYRLFLITISVTIFNSHSTFSYENPSQTKSEIQININKYKQT